MQTRYADVGVRLFVNGYSVVPAQKRSKRPAVAGWSRELVLADIRRYAQEYADYGVFAHCSGVVGLDNDVEDHALNAKLTDISTSLVGRSSVCRLGKEPRKLLLYRTDSPVHTKRMPGFEIRGTGAGVILFGIHPTTNRPYHYEDLTPLDVPVAELPLATPDALQQLLTEAAALLGHDANPLLSSTIDRSVATDLMTDGRERFVRDQIWQHYLQGWTSASAISEQVFTLLSRQADLTRPHASGANYDLAFVHSRVLSTLRSAKPIFNKGPRPSVEAVVLSGADKEAFRNGINEAGALGHLRPASVLVSHAMLGSIGVANSAYVSTATLAHRTGLAVDTVKRARRELREKGYWVAVDDAGGRAKIAHYLPVLEGETEHE